MVQILTIILSQKLTLITAWISTTIQYLHSYEFTLVDKAVLMHCLHRTSFSNVVRMHTSGTKTSTHVKS